MQKRGLLRFKLNLAKAKFGHRIRRHGDYDTRAVSEDRHRPPRRRRRFFLVGPRTRKYRRSSTPWILDRGFRAVRSTFRRA